MSVCACAAVYACATACVPSVIAPSPISVSTAVTTPIRRP